MNVNGSEPKRGSVTASYSGGSTRSRGELVDQNLLTKHQGAKLTNYLVDCDDVIQKETAILTQHIMLKILDQ
jgi:hypothetical protein